MIISVPVVVIEAPVLSKATPVLLKPPGTVTAPFRSIEPPLVMLMEAASMVLFETTEAAPLISAVPMVSAPREVPLPVAPLNWTSPPVPAMRSSA